MMLGGSVAAASESLAKNIYVFANNNINYWLLSHPVGA